MSEEAVEDDDNLIRHNTFVIFHKDHEPFEVTADHGALAMLEIQFRLPTAQGIPLSFAHVSWLGWYRLLCLGGVAVDWETWNRGFEKAEPKGLPEPGGPYGDGYLTPDSATYEIVLLALQTGQPLSEIRNATENELNCFRAILSDWERLNEEAEQPGYH